MTKLRQGLEDGHWTWLPEYPLGHAQIKDHLPYSIDNILLLFSLLALLGICKLIVFTVLDACLTKKQNTRRFKTVIYFTIFHILSTAYNTRNAPDPTLDFFQNPLPNHLRIYYIVQIAYTLQSFSNLDKGELTMTAHHLITLSVLIFSWRYGFVRIGQQVRAQ